MKEVAAEKLKRTLSAKRAMTKMAHLRAELGSLNQLAGVKCQRVAEPEPELPRGQDDLEKKLGAEILKNVHAVIALQMQLDQFEDKFELLTQYLQ
jgi:hypothetical protein